MVLAIAIMVRIPGSAASAQTQTDAASPVPSPVAGALAPLAGTIAPVAGALLPSPAPPPEPVPARPPVAAGPCAGAPASGRAILLNLADQQLTACQDGGPVLTTPVTTGRPELPTPAGSYSVLRKVSPWVMRSPWSRRSRFWYPPSRVTYTLWFLDPGYAIHDAPWRDAYGAGTEAQGSHGCVNVPRPAMDQLYAWADVGVPVLIS